MEIQYSYQGHVNKQFIFLQIKISEYSKLDITFNVVFIVLFV
jgi:hypothetical protein